MPYLRDRQCVDCARLAELVVRRGGDPQEAAERLANHLKLKALDKLKLKATIRRMLEGSYLRVRARGR